MSVDVPCGDSRGALESALATHELLVTDAGEWLIIHPTRSVINAERQVPYAWKRVRVVPRIEHRPSRDALPLDAEETQAIGRRAIAVSRLTPIGFPPDTGDEYDAELLVTIDAVRLRPGVDSVVVVLGFAPTLARLVYGERRAGEYVPLWDSPILSARGGDLGWKYEDVDHDGRSEIAFVGSEFPSNQTLVMFNLDGVELTRNGNCYVNDRVIRNTDPSCPILGTEIEIETLKSGETRPRDIFVYEPDARYNERYRLKNGVYVLFGRPPSR